MDRRRFLQTGGVAAGSAALGLTVATPATANPGTAATALTGSVGWADNDLDPRTGPLKNFGHTGGFALDCLYRTVGTDLGEQKSINAVELISERPSHRLNPRDLAVYVSDDNAGWRKLDADFLDLGTSIWLYNLDAEARYVAVHCHREGAGSVATFANANLQRLLVAHRIPAGSFIAGSGSWPYRTELRVINDGPEPLEDRAGYVSLAQLGVPAMIKTRKAAADLSDLRFATAEGRQLPAYCDGRGIFVRVPRLAAGETRTLHLYSGNPDATSVLADATALQVEYGHRTFQPQSAKSAAGLTFGGELHPVRLPDGTLLIASNTTAVGGIHARYSFDDGRTWTVPEPMITASDPARGTDRAGGFLVDPDTGVLTAIFYSVGVSNGNDWTDPSQHLCQVWVAQADRYVDRKPVFGTPRPQVIMNHETGRPASWTITYTDPIKTTSGAYVVSVPYIFRPDGQFALAVLRSTDGGATWRQSATSLTLSVAGFEEGVSESTIAQLRSGALVIYARQQTDSKYHFGTSTSTDDGVTWAELTDSRILASNTQPTTLNRGADVIIGWPGHNAFGQKSYRRNNFTLAATRDDGRTFHGHQDVTGATSLSTPGWKDTREQRLMVESFIVPAGDHDLLVGWASGPATAGSTLLVEDLDRFLYRSHGALDVLRHLDPTAVDGGRELAQSRWWRSTRGGQLDLVPGPNTAGRALRLRTSEPAVPAAASRLFPGTRKARLRFRLRWSELGSGLRIALQEGFAAPDVPNVGANARGTVALFRLAADGSVQVTTEDVYDAVPVGGFLENDVDPRTGNLGLLKILPVAFDYNRRSVGLDLQQPREVTSIVLTGLQRFATDGTSTRLEPEDVRVWASETNRGDWREITGWSGTKDGLVITLTGPAFSTRYLKLTQPYADKAFTYANDLEQLVRVLPERPDLEHPQDFGPLPEPTTLPADAWHTFRFDVDLDAGTVVTMINGRTVAELPVLRTAETLTHLLLQTETGGRTEVGVAEFLLQDTTHGLPSITRIGLPAQGG